MTGNEVANFKDFQLLLLSVLSFFFFFFPGTYRDLTSGHLEDPTTSPTTPQLVLEQELLYLLLHGYSGNTGGSKTVYKRML